MLITIETFGFSRGSQFGDTKQFDCDHGGHVALVDEAIIYLKTLKSQAGKRDCEHKREMKKLGLLPDNQD